MSVLGDKIRSARLAKNLTQQDVADKMGLSRHAICNWEAGIRNPSVSKLKEFASVVEIPFAFFSEENIELNIGQIIAQLRFLFSSSSIDKDTKEKIFKDLLRIYLDPEEEIFFSDDYYFQSEETEESSSFSLGMKIKQLRVAKELTQQNVADALGVTRGLVSRWEKDERGIGLDHLLEYSRFMGVSLDFFCESAPNKTAFQLTTQLEDFFLSENTETEEKDKTYHEIMKLYLASKNL